VSVSKGRISNLNKKLIAGLLAVTFIIPLTGCGEMNTGNYPYLEYEKDNSGKMICNDVMTYGQISETKVISLGFDGKQTIYLAHLVDYSSVYSKRPRTYRNVFGWQILYQTLDEDTELTILYEANLVDYLVSYDKVQNTYTEQELKDILEQIKADYELQKDKQLVKE